MQCQHIGKRWFVGDGGDEMNTFLDFMIEIHCGNVRLVRGEEQKVICER